MQSLVAEGKYKKAMNPAAAGTGDTLTGITIDTQNQQRATFSLSMGTITGGAVTTAKLQQGNLANGSDMADVEGSAISIPDTGDDLLYLLEIQRPRGRYVRLVVTRATANAVVNGAQCVLSGVSKSPVTQDADVGASKILNAPANGTP